MSDDQFTRLFKYIEEFCRDVDQRFDEVRAEQADMRSAIAKLSAQVRDYHYESVFMSHQMDRLRDAIRQIARETGVKLSAEI